MLIAFYTIPRWIYLFITLFFHAKLGNGGTQNIKYTILIKLYILIKSILSFVHNSWSYLRLNTTVNWLQRLAGNIFRCHVVSQMSSPLESVLPRHFVFQAVIPRGRKIGLKILQLLRNKSWKLNNRFALNSKYSLDEFTLS